MDLLNKALKHKSLGRGTVVSQEGNRFTIAFDSTKVSKFLFDANFSKFFTAENPEVQSAIDAELEKLAEIARKEAEAAALAKQKEEESRQAAIVAREASTTSKKSYVRPERIPGVIRTFYVFQGDTFSQECEGGHLWAPISNHNGDTPFHWENLVDVRAGDIIFHGYRACIQALSIARGECYNAPQPEALLIEGSWSHEGRRVDCDYYVLSNPIKTADHRDAILEHCRVKYAPFDKDGNGNMGYLYDLSSGLAKVFMRAIIDENPEIGEVAAFSSIVTDEDLKQ